MLLDLINILLVILLIIINKVINLYFKITLILLIIFIFRINLYFLYWLIIILNKASQGFYSSQKDNSIIRSEVNFLFNSCFNMKDNFQDLPSYPSIIICNYCYDRLENLASILIPKDISIIMDNKVNNITKLNSLVKNVIIRKGENKNNYNNVKNEIIKNIKNNKSIFVYVNKCCSFKKGYVGRMRSGIFKIAQETKIPITEICIDYIDNNFGIIKKQNFFIKVGSTFIVEDWKKTMKNTRIFFKNCLFYFSQFK
jgi:hypothetical protein